MTITIKAQILKDTHFSYNSLIILPSRDQGAPAIKNEWCAFSHGFTASKSDCFSWATRLAEQGVPSIIFDQPGHYLGGIHEVEDFETYKSHAHETFEVAFKALEEEMLKYAPFNEPETIILGGHSLSALLSMKALNLDYFTNKKTLAIGVGIGMGEKDGKHFYDNVFYEKTLQLRNGLVSDALNSDNVFPWIGNEKANLDLKGKRIHMITGKDDIVVGSGGMEVMMNYLSKNNTVTSFEPGKLPHHKPSHAATFISSFLKKEFDWD